MIFFNLSHNSLKRNKQIIADAVRVLTVSTGILVIVLLEYINLLQFCKLLLLAQVTYNQVQPLQINYLIS